jgi:hypothetical protein
MAAIRIALLALVVALGSAVPAAAGTYSVYSCKLPNGAIAPTEGWTSQVAGTQWSVPENSCASGGSLAARLNGDFDQAANVSMSWIFSVPADTTLRNFQVWRSMSNTTGYDTNGNATPLENIAFPARAPGQEYSWCAAAEGCLSRGSHLNWSATDNYFSPGQTPSTTSVWFVAACGSAFSDAACSDRNSATPMAEIRVHALRAYIEDASDPTATVSGPLVGGGPHKGTESVTVNASDKGAGVYRVRVEVKPSGTDHFSAPVDSVFDPNDGKCAPVDFDSATDLEFTHLVPCKLSGSRAFSLDTTTLPEGTSELRVLVRDAAGNEQTVYGPAPFAVDNVPPPNATSSPTIAGGKAEGDTLVANIGTWTGKDNTYTKRWLRCASTAAESCAPIAGAEGDTYKTGAGDVAKHLRLEVTATNSEGTNRAVSAPFGPITGAPTSGGSASPTPTASPTTSATASPAPGGTPAAGGGDRAADRGEANGTNASDHARLSLTGPRVLAVGFGRSARTMLSLRDENGRPIGGAAVAVLQRVAVPGGAWVPAHAPLVTDGDGHVRYLIDPGYSRTLRFAYRSHGGDAAFAATRELTLRVRSKTTFRTNRNLLHNGHTVRFLGRLVSRPVPRAGVVIDLQARVGRRWQTFTTVRTKADGRWRASYRFRHTTGFQTYVFRARVRGDTGFPYTPSISRHVSVHVRG